MQKPAFTLKELSIQKMPGFPRGLEAYERLSPFINIIAGPNASGKSSTARIIQRVIWRHQTDGIQVESSVEIDKVSWEIKIDSHNIVIQRDGKDDEFTGLPAFEESGRYMLALHELVKEDDGDLARQIVKESIGGYDLEKARDKLGYIDGIKHRGAAEFKEYEGAERKYKDILQKQKALRKEEEKLEQLYVIKQQTEEANRVQGLYQIVILYLEAKLKFDQLSEEFKAFDTVLDKVTGEEYTSIEDMEEDSRGIEEAIAECENERQKHVRTISDLNLPDDGVNEEVLLELEERIERLIEHERKIQDLKIKIGGFKVKEEEALQSIDKNLDPSEWKNINIEQVNGLDEFLQNAHLIFSEKQFLETEINELKKETNNKEAKNEVLTDGIRSLSYWLQEQTGASGPSKWWLVILSVVGILTIIVTYFIRLPGLLGILVIIVLTIYALRTEQADTTNIREQDYSKTGLELPGAWNTNSVTEKLKELIEALEEAKWQEKIKQKVAIHNSGLENLQDRISQIDEKRNEWLLMIKAIPEIPENNLKNYTGLYWFLIHVKEWQKYDAEVRALSRENEQLANDIAENLARINLLLTQSKAEKAGEGIIAKSLFRKLKDKVRIHNNSHNEIERQKISIREKTEQQRNVLQKVKDIYNKLDTEEDNKERIRQLMNDLNPYKKVKENYTVAERLLAEKEILMKDHSLFEARKADIQMLSLDQAITRNIEAKTNAEKFNQINNEIVEIETNVKREKEGNALEDALRNREEALDDLMRLRENNLSSLTGKLLIDQLKNETREQNRPKVFKNANEIFNRITKGQYELRLEEKESPSFKAYDTVLKLGQDLNELSTGTRIQLLLSVRLAFIETQETAIKLPILADELLANSDDSRAKSIIEALVEIGKEGRQVFYFTAQDDEVIKWKTYLEAQNTPYEIIELTGKQNETIKRYTSEGKFSALSFSQSTPDPGDKSHEEYGKVLQVPPFSFLTEEIEGLHLWYIIEDNDVLSKSLNKGIKFWGQLDSFIKYNGVIEKLNGTSLNTLDAKIKFLRRFQELYRRGRPRPINRKILEESESVSYKFIEEMTEKLGELDGNPQKLIEALRNGEVSGFRSNKIEEMEQYFIGEGFLYNEEALGKDAIIVQLNAFLSNLDLNITEAESCINRILNNGI